LVRGRLRGWGEERRYLGLTLNLSLGDLWLWDWNIRLSILALINQILVAISSHFPEILGFKFNEVETIAVVVPNKLIYLGHWDGRVNTSGAKSRGIRMYRD
jgi:hypothetical protein